jgi:hypothetical protein
VPKPSGDDPEEKARRRVHVGRAPVRIIDS